ncbi:MAG: SCP2 sterol-binding domain-containing protein [Reinekea sp.]
MHCAKTLYHSPLVIKAKGLARQLSRGVKPVNRGTALLARILGHLPSAVQQRPLAPLLNHALGLLIEEGEFDFLEGRCCRIAVRNCDLHWNLTMVNKRLVLLPDQPADVTISATVPAFLSLISQSADPDTLFFQRQLSIEGDVELGLQVKNLLDALDQDELPTVWRQALLSLKTLVQWEAA